MLALFFYKGIFVGWLFPECRMFFLEIVVFQKVDRKFKDLLVMVMPFINITYSNI